MFTKLLFALKPIYGVFMTFRPNRLLMVFERLYMIIDFKTLRLHSKPNQFLIAPEGFCEEARVHDFAEIFGQPVDQLQDTLLQIILETARIVEVDQDEARRQFAFVATTALMRFKDDVNVQFIEIGPEQSSFAIYSRSRVGYGDMGANRKRVMAWLDQLD